MSAMIDSPVRHVNRHRAHSLRPDSARDTPVGTAAQGVAATQGVSTQAGTEPQVTTELPWAAEEVWAAEDAWDDRSWDEEVADPVPAPAVATRPAVGPGPAAQPGDGLAVPPRRTVGPFPPIRAGGGRHRLPTAVRRRPGPIAAGLMVAATTLAAGSLRFSAPPPLRASADAGHQCAPLLPGEPCG